MVKDEFGANPICKPCVFILAKLYIEKMYEKVAANAGPNNFTKRKRMYLSLHTLVLRKMYTN